MNLTHPNSKLRDVIFLHLEEYKKTEQGIYSIGLKLHKRSALSSLSEPRNLPTKGYVCIWALHLTPAELYWSQHGLTGLSTEIWGIPRANISWELYPLLLSNYGFLSRGPFRIFRLSLPPFPPPLLFSLAP